MGKSKQDEMVTIEVPLDWAESRAASAQVGAGNCGVNRACRAALAARRNPYEVWRENMEWLVVQSRRIVSGKYPPMIKSQTSESMRLMAAAPALLEALIAVRASLLVNGMGVMAADTDNPIRKALPLDVADCVLGDDS